MVIAMKLNLIFVFIAELVLWLIKNHYKTWTKEGNSLHYGPRKKKFNIILSVSINNIIHLNLQNKI